MPCGPSEDFPSRVSYSSLKKEAALLFLSLFYFIVATNTQTGWLFVLSAFLIGLLLLCWLLSRRRLQGLSVKRSFSSIPQQDHPFRVEISLVARGSSPQEEIRVESPAPKWGPKSSPLRWSLPYLPTERPVQHLYKLLPIRRGEHTLPPLTIISGAPFGLFTVEQTFTHTEPFLIYPEVVPLPLRHRRNALSSVLGDFVSNRDRGDSRNFRSVRDYAPGDDLRQVHWKASAKRDAESPLLVREYHRRLPTRSVLLLDNSARGQSQERCELFERAVVLATSLLWAAHREGTHATLYLLEPDGRWVGQNRWSHQHTMLARVVWNTDLDFETWCDQAKHALGRHLPRQKSHPILITATDSRPVSAWPDWAERILLVDDPMGAPDYPPHPGIMRLDGVNKGFVEITSRV